MDNQSVISQQIRLEPAEAPALAALCGQFDEHLKQIEQRLYVSISRRGELFEISGEDSERVAATKSLIVTSLFL